MIKSTTKRHNCSRQSSLCISLLLNLCTSRVVMIASFVYGGHSATQISPESQQRFWLDRLHDVQYSTTTRTTTLTILFLLVCYSVTTYSYIQNSLHILEGYHITVTWPDTTLCWTPWDINDIKPLCPDAGRDPNSLLCRATLTGLKFSKAGTNSSTSYFGFRDERRLGPPIEEGKDPPPHTGSPWAYTFSSTWPWWWWHFETLQRLPRHKTSPTIHRASFVVLTISCNWNGWFEIPDLASRRSREAHLLRFIVSKSRSSAVGVSYIQRSSTRLDAQIKSHNNTKLICTKSWQHAKTRLSKEGNELPKFCIFNEFERQPRSSKEGKVALQKCLYRI